MTTKVIISCVAGALHQVLIGTNFGDPIKVNPGEDQVVDIYPGHEITSITEGDLVPAQESNTEVQLTELQKADITELLAVYPDKTIGVGGEDGVYKLVDEAGNVFAEGTVEALKEAAKTPDDAPAADAAGTNNPAKENTEGPAQESNTETPKEEKTAE